MSVRSRIPKSRLRWGHFKPIRPRRWRRLRNFEPDAVLRFYGFGPSYFACCKACGLCTFKDVATCECGGELDWLLRQEGDPR